MATKTSRSGRHLRPARSTTVSEQKAQHEERLHSYNETFLYCRDLRHAWEYTGAPYRSGGGVISRRLVCSRCKTERVDNWTGRGERYGARYIYPDDYQMKGDLYDYSEIRKEILQRFTVFENEEAALISITSRSRRNGSRRWRTG